MKELRWANAPPRRAYTSPLAMPIPSIEISEYRSAKCPISIPGMIDGFRAALANAVHWAAY